MYLYAWFTSLQHSLWFGRMDLEMSVRSLFYYNSKDLCILSAGETETFWIFLKKTIFTVSATWKRWLDFFKFLENVSPLIRKASSVLLEVQSLLSSSRDHSDLDDREPSQTYLLTALSIKKTTRDGKEANIGWTIQFFMTVVSHEIGVNITL